MKKAICLIFTVSLFNTGYTQDNLDSLLNVWQDETQADTIRLEAITIFLHGGEHREFLGYESLNPDSAFVLIEEMHNLLLTNGNKKYELLALGLKGHYLQVAEKEFVEAIALFEECLEM